ncbi:MAG: hypothetical protein U0X92_00115 [Anaerolineales bacterium]
MDESTSLDTGLSFELPKETWSAETRANTNPTVSYNLYRFPGTSNIVEMVRHIFPNISIIVEKLDQEMTIESYDEFVRDSITTAGMEIKSLEPLSKSEFLLPPTKAPLGGQLW